MGNPPNEESDDSTPIRKSQTDLTSLAADIKAAHAGVEVALGTAIDRARHVGNLLIKAKKKIKHGCWAGWVSQSCGLSARQVQRYMQIAREIPKLDPANAS